MPPGNEKKSTERKQRAEPPPLPSEAPWGVQGRRSPPERVQAPLAQLETAQTADATALVSALHVEEDCPDPFLLLRTLFKEAPALEDVSLGDSEDGQFSDLTAHAGFDPVRELGVVTKAPPLLVVRVDRIGLAPDQSGGTSFSDGPVHFQLAMPDVTRRSVWERFLAPFYRKRDDYVLRAVVCYEPFGAGEQAGGHYYAYARGAEGEWNAFGRAAVRSDELVELVCRKVVMFVYEKPAAQAPPPLLPQPHAEGDECVCCLQYAKTHACVPCGHKAVCGACAGRLHRCPICRADAREMVRIYG